MFGFMWFYRHPIKHNIKHNIKHSDIADNYVSMFHLHHVPVIKLMIQCMRCKRYWPQECLIWDVFFIISVNLNMVSLMR